jgi:hypothetical protein
VTDMCIMRNTVTSLSRTLEIKTGFPLREAAKHDAQGDALLVQMKDVDALNGVNWSSAATPLIGCKKMIFFLSGAEAAFSPCMFLSHPAQALPLLTFMCCGQAATPKSTRTFWYGC